jgi:hypothetical protein
MAQINVKTTFFDENKAKCVKSSQFGSRLERVQYVEVEPKGLT